MLPTGGGNRAYLDLSFGPDLGICQTIEYCMGFSATTGSRNHESTWLMHPTNHIWNATEHSALCVPDLRSSHAGVVPASSRSQVFR